MSKEEVKPCNECGGEHERSGARSDCIRHWQLRALQAENTVSVEKHYGGILGAELRQWLNGQDINGGNIGSIRRQCFVPWDSNWNALVRDETAGREKNLDAPSFCCETCPNTATVHIKSVGLHFCQSCIEKIDEKIRTMP